MTDNLQRESIRSEEKFGRGSKKHYYNTLEARKALKEISNCGVHNLRKATILKNQVGYSKHYNSVIENTKKIEISTILTRSKGRIINETLLVVSEKRVINDYDTRELKIVDKHKEFIKNNEHKYIRPKTVAIKQAVDCKNDESNRNGRKHLLENRKAEEVACAKKGIRKKKDSGGKEIDKSCVEEPYREYEGNIFLCTHYVKDIYSYLTDLEDYFLVKKDFLRGMNITPSMRAKLVDWLIDVQVLFKLSNESLHLSVFLVDSYLEKNADVAKDELQLVGVTSLFVAGKYEDVHPPHLKDYIETTEGACNLYQVLGMEIKLLKSVDMRLSKPTIMGYLRRLGIVADIDKVHHCCSKFFVEACLMNYSSAHYRSSLVAAAATFLSLCLKSRLVSPSIWTKDLVTYSNYDLYDIYPVLRRLAPFVVDLPKTDHSSGILDKYSLPIFLRVKNKIYNSSNIELIKKIGQSQR